MKKLCVLLAVLVAASPALAAVRITAEPNGPTVAIKYATDGEKVRAFALDITVDNGIIVGISDFIRGESTAAEPATASSPPISPATSRSIPTRARWPEGTSTTTPVADPCDAARSADWAPAASPIEDGRPVLSDRGQFPEPPAEQRDIVQADGQRAGHRDGRGSMKFAAASC
jgi:hypothetical protein